MTEQPAQSWNRREQIAGTYPAASANREPPQMPSEAVSTAVEMSIQKILLPLLRTKCLSQLAAGLILQSVSCIILQRFFFFFFLPSKQHKQDKPLAQGVCQLELLQQALFPSSITSPCPKEHAGMHHL